MRTSVMVNEHPGAESSASNTSAVGNLPVEFCVPLWGLPEQSSYVLWPAAREGVWWMQSNDEAATTFVLADPFMIDTAYAIDLGEKERELLCLEASEDALTLVMLALPPLPGGLVTGNFRAPIVINVRNRTALQVVSRDESHEIQRKVNLGVYPLRDSVDQSTK